MAQLEIHQVTLAAGEHDLVASPVVVPHAQLSTGVGLLPPTDGACSRRQPLQGDFQFGDVGPRRSMPLPSRAGTQAFSPTAAMAASSGPETRPPTENSQLRAIRPSMNERTAPAVSARTNTGWPTTSAWSPGWCPVRHSAGTGRWPHRHGKLIGTGVRPALPGRRMPARASPVASRKQNIGWNPKHPCVRPRPLLVLRVDLHQRGVNVEHHLVRGAAASHTATRALARASRNSPRTVSSTWWSARQMVEPHGPAALRDYCSSSRCPPDWDSGRFGNVRIPHHEGTFAGWERSAHRSS